MMRAATFKRTLLSLSLCMGFGAQAQLFADDEARRAILDLRAQVETLRAAEADQAQRLEAMATGQLGLLQRIEELRSELAQLRGGIEEARQSGRNNDTRQKELFSSLEAQLQAFESRLVKLEPQSLEVDGETLMVSHGQRLAFEQARKAMAAGQLATAAEAFSNLAKEDGSALRPSALYYEGILRYSLKDFKASASALTAFIKLSPKHARAADGMLTLAAAQAESGQLKSARTTLAQITQRFPGTEQAKTAQSRLKLLPKAKK